MARPAHVATSLLELLQTHHLLTVSELLALLQEKEGTAYNKTTVYRALEKLESEDLICRHTINEDEARFELRSTHHDHLVCTRCGKIESVSCQLQLPQKLNGFALDHHHLTIFGVCADCQKLA